MARDNQRILITGVLGQDGWYLARRLLEEGHDVHGTFRGETWLADADDGMPALELHRADLEDESAVVDVVARIRPTRVFNLAGSTSVARSWRFPTEAAEVLGVGAVRLMSAVWELHQAGLPVRFLQASSAEIFGDPTKSPQTENTPIAPVTPYGAAKAFAHSMVRVYRRRGMFAAAAVLYNHESPRRPTDFVAAKIARRVAEIAAGHRDSLTLGNMDVARDWGYAPDYVAAMCTILDADTPDDYIIATGEPRSVRDFVREAFSVVGINDWQRHVEVDPDLFRPADPRSLVGDSSRIRSLGWRPSVNFEELVRILVEAQLESLASATA